jgi:hypothetical protein
MEGAVAGTSAVAPVEGIESAIDIDIDTDVDNLINNVDPIGAAFDPRMPNTEVPTSITCVPNRSPRDKNIRDMVNKEDAFDEGYDSDGKMGPFYNRTDKEGQQLFNEDDDDGVGFVAERAIDDERETLAPPLIRTLLMTLMMRYMYVHVPIIDLDTLNKMNLNQLKNKLKLRQQLLSSAKNSNSKNN